MIVDLTVDPGLRGCGYAWWMKNTLLVAGYAPGKETGDGPSCWAAAAGAVFATLPVGALSVGRVGVETMRMYTTGKADPRDILELQGVSSAVATWAHVRYGAEVLGVPSDKWKRQVPRKIMGARVEKRLAALGWMDRVIVPSQKTRMNDVMHAVGIGLYLQQT